MYKYKKCHPMECIIYMAMHCEKCLDLLGLLTEFSKVDGYKIKYQNQLHFHNQKTFRKYNFHRYILVAAKVR